MKIEYEKIKEYVEYLENKIEDLKKVIVIKNMTNKIFNKKDNIIFHGGCHGCTRQKENDGGIYDCIKCCYFDADWNLPDMNNKPKDISEIIKDEIKSWHKNRNMEK